MILSIVGANDSGRGAMIGEAGAGAKPVPYKELTADKLADGIKQLLTEEAANAAKKIADSIEAEGDGAKNAVTSFHRSLVLRGEHSMRCSILEDRVAVWTLKNTRLRLCALAAELLVRRKRITWKQLRLIRHNEWNDYEGPGEPISGTTTAVVGSVTKMATGIGSIPFRITKTTKKRAAHEEKKKKLSMDASRKSMDSKSTGKKTLKKSVDAGRKSEDVNATHGADNATAKKNVQFDGNAESGDSHTVDKHKENGFGNHHKIDSKEPTQEPEPQSLQQQLSNIEQAGRKDVRGEPIVQKTAAQEEHEQQQQKHPEAHPDDDPDEAELSDDPEIGPAEEIAQDVGVGLGKTAEGELT